MRYARDRRTLSLALCSLVLLAGCAGISERIFPQQEPEPEVAVAEPVILTENPPEFRIGSGGIEPERLDTTSDAQLASAASVGGGNILGDTVASLGDPTKPGLWLRTPLVTSETPGRVTLQGGKSLAVTLIPIEGEATAGSQISLAAMRGLELGLTDLPTLQVYRVSESG